MESNNRAIYWVPYVLWIALFVVAPILLIVYYSFQGLDGEFTLANYRNFFTPVYFNDDPQLVLVCVSHYTVLPAYCVPGGLLYYTFEV